jgi:hypothetical protein
MFRPMTNDERPAPEPLVVYRWSLVNWLQDVCQQDVQGL